MNSKTSPFGMSTQPAFTVLDDTDVGRGIAEVAHLSGLSQDTLRWYEREGLLPAVHRGTDRRRRYTRRDAALVAHSRHAMSPGRPRSAARGRGSGLDTPCHCTQRAPTSSRRWSRTRHYDAGTVMNRSVGCAKVTVRARRS